jgi:hypothetical protein
VDSSAQHTINAPEFWAFAPRSVLDASRLFAGLRHPPQARQEKAT